MNKYLEQLVELSSFDKQISDFIPKINEIKGVLSEKESEISKVQAQISQTNTEIDELKNSISQTDTHIKEFSTKLKDIKKKLSAIKTEKELKALNIEEEVTKEQLQSANDDIARFEKNIEIKSDLLKALNEKLEALEEKFVKISKDYSTKESKLNSEKEKISAKKYALLEKMDKNIISFYEKIQIWAGNSAVTPVKKQACYGCYMKINDKTYMSILKSDDIITCPHCGRILYKEAE